jgi:hypothetical protein
MALDQLDRLGHLVAEVEPAPPPLLGRVALDQAGQLDPLPGRLEHPVGQPLALVGPLQQAPGRLDHPLGRDDVVGAGRGQLEGLADGGPGRADAEVLEPLAVEDAEQDLVLLGLAEQVGVDLDPHPDPVRLDEVGRPGVVGVDGDLVADVGREVGQGLADPGLQLAGRLVGEGQPEHRGRARPRAARPGRRCGPPSPPSCRTRRRRSRGPGRAGR